MGSSTTTRNFGMRRFTNLVREGRFRAPAASELVLGTLVEIDPTDPDRVRQATAAVIGGSASTQEALVGLLWYEHDSQTYEGAAAGTLMQDYNTAPAGRMVQVLHGPGAKVWFRNTAQDTTEPGLHYPATRDAVTMVDGLGAAGVAVGDLLGWDTTGYFAVTTTLSEAVLRVTYVDDDLAVCDAELLV